MFPVDAGGMSRDDAATAKMLTLHTSPEAQGPYTGYRVYYNKEKTFMFPPTRNSSF